MSVQGRVFLAYSILVLAVLWHEVGGSRSYGHHHHGGSGSRIISAVSYAEPAVEKRLHVTHEVVHHVVHRKRNRRRKVVVVEPEPPHISVPGAGSYVAVAGGPDYGSVHVVENVPSLGADNVVVVNGVRVRNTGYGPGRRVEVGIDPGSRGVAGVPPPVPHPSLVPGVAPRAVQVPQVPFPQVPLPQVPVAPRLPSDGVAGDRLPLPKCSYVNTDFPGDSLYDDDDGDDDDEERFRRGVNSGSARACKALCRLEEDCNFWTYKEGFNRDTSARDCFLKQGTPGLPVPREAVPRIGFVSGTKDNNCVCIMSEDEEDEVCPYKNPRGLVYPWRSTDQEEDDMARGLPPTGWRRVGGEPLYPGLAGANPLYPGLPGGSLEDEVRGLRAQLDILTSRLNDDDDE